MSKYKDYLVKSLKKGCENLHADNFSFMIGTNEYSKRLANLTTY